MRVDLPTLRASRARLDARLDEARARLRSATDPITIEECLVEEATVAVELELLADRASSLAPNALAAAVWLGDLSVDDAIELVCAMAPSERSVAIGDLSVVLDARAWLALTSAVPEASSQWWAWMTAARERGAVDDIIAVSLANNAVSGETVAYVFERWGAEVASRLGPLVREALAQSDAQRASAGGEGIEDEGLLLLALPVDEAAPRALELYQTIDAIEEGELYFDEGYDELDPRAAAVIALSHAGELTRARALFERMLSRPRPWLPVSTPLSLTESIVRAHRALCAASTPEPRAALEQRLFAWLEISTTREARRVARASEVLDEPWAERAAERLVALMDAADSSDKSLLEIKVTHAKARGVSVARKCAALVELFAKPTLVHEEIARAVNLWDALPKDDEGAVEFALEHAATISRVLSGGEPARSSDSPWLREAASRGSRRALAWLEDRVARGLVWGAEAQQFVWLPKALVRRLFDDAPAASLSPNRRRAWAHLAISFARGVGDRERSVVCAAHDRACEALRTLPIELASVIARGEQAAFVRAYVPSALRGPHSASALMNALEDPEARCQAFAAATEHFATSDRRYTGAEWIDTSITALVSEACAAKVLAGAYGEREVPLSALHPAALLRALDAADLERELQWVTLLQRRAVVAAIRALPEGKPALERAARAVFRGWRARGCALDDPAWQAIFELVPHVSSEDAIAWAAHPWPIDSVSLAHALVLALYEHRDKLQAEAALRALLDRFEAASDRGWCRAVRTFVRRSNTKRVEDVFRGCAEDAARTGVERDAVALGIVDELLPLGVSMPSAAALEWAAQLLPHARSESVRRARAWVERALRASGERGFERLRDDIALLGRDAIVRSWVTGESRSRPSVVLARPWALAALGGPRVIERIAALAAKALEQCGRGSLVELGREHA